MFGITEFFFDPKLNTSKIANELIIINKLALSGVFGATFESDATGYLFVYHLEILIIFITLISLGSLSQELNKQSDNKKESNRFGLAEIPS